MSFQDALKRIRHIAECLEDDDPDKLDMMNVEGDYSGLMEWAIRKRSENIAMETANKGLADMYKDRANRFANKADSMKDILGYIMDCANEKSYKGVAGTVAKKHNPPKPVVTDESKVPDEYKKKVIDKTAINQAVKDGKQIEGVSMDNGSETITVRTK